MSKIDAEKMREKILAEKERLTQDRHNLRGEGGVADEVGEIASADPNHPGDTATELFERGKDMALDANLGAQLAQIEDALSRIDAGTYGTCERCGKEIPAARLNALPYATLCIECQETVENTQ